MAYCTLSDLVKKKPQQNFVELTNDAGGDTVVQAVIDDAIREADTIINGYLAGRYTLPLATTPPMILDISCNLAIRFLYGRRVTTIDPESTVEVDYKNALAMLDKIAKNLMSIPELTVDNPAESFDFRMSSSDRIFTDDLLNKL